MVGRTDREPRQGKGRGRLVGAVAAGATALALLGAAGCSAEGGIFVKPPNLGVSSPTSTGQPIHSAGTQWSLSAVNGPGGYPIEGSITEVRPHSDDNANAHWIVVEDEDTHKAFFHSAASPGNCLGRPRDQIGNTPVIGALLQCNDTPDTGLPIEEVDGKWQIATPDGKMLLSVPKKLERGITGHYPPAIFISREVLNRPASKETQNSYWNLPSFSTSSEPQFIDYRSGDQGNVVFSFARRPETDGSLAASTEPVSSLQAA